MLEAAGVLLEPVEEQVLEPALDEFDRREMRGCLEDTRVQHLLVEVRQLESVVPGPVA